MEVVKVVKVVWVVLNLMMAIGPAAQQKLFLLSPRWGVTKVVKVVKVVWVVLNLMMAIEPSQLKERAFSPQLTHTLFSPQLTRCKSET